MSTQAAIGFGTLFKVRTATGPDVFTTIGEQTNVTPFGVSVDSIDASHMQSPNAWREFIAGLKDAGEASVDINYVPGGSTETLLFSLLGSAQVFRTVFPSGAIAQYSGIITEISPETPLDDKMAVSLTVKISGQITLTAAAAPVNTLLPSVAGSDATPSSGDTLTAVEGVWSGEPATYTYQWKKDGSNISGATNKTYTVVGGDSTHAISVAVTAGNSAGSATATSAPLTIS